MIVQSPRAPLSNSDGTLAFRGIFCLGVFRSECLGLCKKQNDGSEFPCRPLWAVLKSKLTALTNFGDRITMFLIHRLVTSLFRQRRAQSELFRGIVLTGGSTLFEGFAERNTVNGLIICKPVIDLSKRRQHAFTAA